MKILCVGDIVGKPGRNAVKRYIPEIKKENNIDFIIVNAENAAGGSGITPDTVKELFSAEIDVITSGDHIWKKKESYDILNKDKRVLRPANYPQGAPGLGAVVKENSEGIKVGVINLLGRVFMSAVECPFKTAKKEIERLKQDTNIIIVDIHAEATSEKVALGWYLDGKVTAVVGTHTHIPTADQRLLHNGTAYITDIGMTGPYDSVIGRKQEPIIERYLTQMPTKFKMASENVQLYGVIIEADKKTGKALSIARIVKK